MSEDSKKKRCPRKHKKQMIIIILIHLISARRSDLVIFNKKREPAELWTLMSQQTRVKLKEIEKKDKYMDLVRELKKTMEHERDQLKDTTCNQHARYSHQKISKRSGEIGDKSTYGDHTNYYTVKIRKKTEKILGDLRRLEVVSQALVEDHWLTLAWKALKGVQ